MIEQSYGLKICGEGVVIHEFVRLIRPERIEILDGTQIDDFVLINGSGGVRIGRKNHFASFTSVVGGGELITGDFVGVAAGARLVTGTHHYGEGKRISPLIPEEDQCVIRGKIILEDDVFLGTNSVVMPGVTVGEGAIVGAGALVLRDLEPWSINVGSPCRKIGERPRIKD